MRDNASTSFALGKVVATPGALSAIAKQLGIEPDLPDDATKAREWLGWTANIARGLIRRHASGDWGDLGDEDKAANLRSIQEGSRILSAYVLEGVKFYVITEAEDDDGCRACTTLLLAGAY